MARPKKNDEDKYKHSVTFWVTDDEWNTISERSQAGNMTVSDYIRSILHGKNIKLHYVVETTFPDIVEKINEVGKPLSGIGNNLNQIARKLNSGSELDDRTADKIAYAQNDIRRIRIGLEELEAEANGAIRKEVR